MNIDQIPKSITDRIEEYDRNLDRWTYYDLLYITRNATSDDIKKAYRKLVQLMHPDRYGIDLDSDYKAKLERIFNEINHAYNLLLDEGERIKYDQSLYYAEDHGQPLKIDKETQVAQAQYQRGLQALQKKEVIPAIEFFKSAINLDPDQPQYHARLAMALSNHPNPRVRKDAIAACKEAIKLNQENPDFHALMGKIHHKLGDLESAEVCYRRALSWTPQHGLARQGLAAINEERAAKAPPTLSEKLKSFFNPKKKPGK